MTAQDIIDILIQDFPGLSDNDSEVNGADLVDALTALIDQYNKGS